MSPAVGSAPSVSVIIPVFGTAPFVPAALDSVLAQTYTHYEIVVVNDGSPDSALLDQLIKPYLDRIIYLVQENRGSSTARNAGIKAASGKYIAILDSDDYWHPEYLASQVAVLDSDPAIDVVYPDAFRFNAAGEFTRQFSRQHPVGGEISFLRVLSRQCEIYGGATVRRDTVVRVGLYDEKLRTGEDFDLWLRILKAGGRVAYNDRVLAYYRERPGSLTSNDMALVKNMLGLLDRLETKMDLSTEERRAIDRQRANALGSLALSEGKAALRAGDRATAIAKLSEAYRHTGRWKVGAVLLGLRVFPGLVESLYRKREL
jgi:glycosyltransferase involved in cell wall biosynthesis